MNSHEFIEKLFDMGFYEESHRTDIDDIVGSLIVVMHYDYDDGFKLTVRIQSYDIYSSAHVKYPNEIELFKPPFRAYLMKKSFGNGYDPAILNDIIDYLEL